ncbi:MAG: gliding motility-associated C-terminal domain-containing protein [Candidatus Latescibacteria bacterium]|nr:gliding motility-associated C-terminal domain-containing protein [Candidatus Latescibacterota bacterium]
MRALVLLLLAAAAALAQPAEHFVLGEADHPWERGGDGRDPTLLINRFGVLNVITVGPSVIEDTTNTPGDALDFARRPGWISPLFFAEDENIAPRLLGIRNGLSTANVSIGEEQLKQLNGMINGNHQVAFERKPTLANPEIKAQNVLLIFDFAAPVGIHRIRFYPRNTVASTPTLPYQFDFLRGYEVWVNPTQTAALTPDLLVARQATNEEPVVDLEVTPQYARLVKLKSLATVPFEIDEVEIYGTGYVPQATYLSDILDLGNRATVGPIGVAGEVVGDSIFSKLTLRVRTGNDDSPILYRKTLRDIKGKVLGHQEVSARAYYALAPFDQATLETDENNWSPWSTVVPGSLLSAPMPRRYLQFQLELKGNLENARQVDRLKFDYLQPPIADTLRAEVYPRLAQAEAPATFRYALRLGALGSVRGFDRLEVDTNGEATNIRAVQVNGRPVSFTVDFVHADGFSLSFPLVKDGGTVLEFSFDLPIFRYGTTFSGRVYHRASGPVPQALEPGNVLQFAPDDQDELSNLFVAIPRQQIGRLIGAVDLHPRLFTPNNDGVNDRLQIDFNLLQLLKPVPVSLDLYDLSGRRLGALFSGDLGLGPAHFQWDGRLDGHLVPPGLYLWVLRVHADAFEERHSGTLGVVY